MSYFRCVLWSFAVFFFFFNDTATTEIYTLSLHDALPISRWRSCSASAPAWWCAASRSEEHTSELQSRGHLVCRLLLEKKKKNNNKVNPYNKNNTSHPATRTILH